MHEGLLLMENTEKLVNEIRSEQSKNFQMSLESVDAATRDDPSYVRLSREKSSDMVERRANTEE
jgi:hypothetical protein